MSDVRKSFTVDVTANTAPAESELQALFAKTAQEKLDLKVDINNTSIRSQLNKFTNQIKKDIEGKSFKLKSVNGDKLVASVKDVEGTVHSAILNMEKDMNGVVKSLDFKSMTSSTSSLEAQFRKLESLQKKLSKINETMDGSSKWNPSNPSNEYVEYQQMNAEIEQILAQRKTLTSKEQGIISERVASIQAGTKKLETAYKNMKKVEQKYGSIIENPDESLKKLTSKSTLKDYENFFSSKGEIDGQIRIDKNQTGADGDRYIVAKGTVIDQATGSLKTYQTAINNTTDAIRMMEVSEMSYGTQSETTTKRFRDKIAEISRYVGSITIVMGALNQLKSGIQVIRDIDVAMTELNKTSDATSEQYANFKKQASSIASEVGSTNSEVIQSAADWSRLGYSIEEVGNLAKNASIYSNVGDLDIDTATSDMVTAMKAFNIEAKNSIKIVDAYNEVGNEFAVSSADIGAAMTRSASALSAGGNNMFESVGMIAGMNEITQSAETTGSTLKILSLRLRGSEADLESMGESTDGVIKSTSKLRDTIKALTNQKVDIMEDDENFKSTYQIMSEIADVWDEMSDINQADKFACVYRNMHILTHLKPVKPKALLLQCG